MTEENPLAQLLMGGRNLSKEEIIEKMKPRSLPEARIAKFAELLERSKQVFHEGQIVSFYGDSGINPAYVGEPHVVLIALRPDQVECSHDDELYKVATEDKDGDVVTAWAAAWRMMPYVAPEPAPKRVRTRRKKEKEVERSLAD